jgi:GH35 family endo-1,4-beta-xylanase
MLSLKTSKWAIAALLMVSVILFFMLKQNKAEAALASGPKFLGNIIAGSVPSNFATYWNQVTPENGTKWGSVEASRDRMNWSQADTAYNYAKSKGMPFKFHTLVWGSQAPNWIGGLSQRDQKAEILEWFDAAAAKYGNADFVDVVNEPLHAPASFQNAIGSSGSTGWDWVVWSFQEARKRFKGKLLINEYGIISDPNAAANYLNIINILKQRNLVDGIGIQCHHFNVDTGSASTMKSVLNKLAATGLPIYVSELDITGDDNTQLARYREKFPVLWEHPSVKGITLWGWIQGQTWRNGTHIISSSGQERPALKWLRQYFASLPSPSVRPSPSPSLSISPNPSRSPGLGDIIDADFESGTEGWLAKNTDTDPVSSTKWSAKGSRSLQADITMAGRTWQYLYKTGKFDLSAVTTIHATVRGANSGDYGEGLGARLFVKYGDARTRKYSDKVIFGPGESAELTLDISEIDRSDIREYGVRFSDGANSSGTTSVNVDNVYAVLNVTATTTPISTVAPTWTATVTPGSSQVVNIPPYSALQANAKLPDPFKFMNGNRMTKKAEWAARRNEISALAQAYEFGAKPPVPSNITGSYSSNRITVNVREAEKSISFSCSISYPSAGQAPYPAIIGIGGSFLDNNAIKNLGVAVINFPNDDIAAQMNTGSRGQGKFYNIYGRNHSAGALIAWAWGVDCLITALEKTPTAKIDPARLGVTGCSRNGKGALAAGAFCERIALTIPQESGSGGAASWRVSDAQKQSGQNVQTLSQIIGENCWFTNSFSQFRNTATKLPYDHHSVAALCAPRALLIIENTSMEWLGKISTWTTGNVAHLVWEALGIPDRMGYSQVSHGDHCGFPASQQPELTAYIQKFLLGRGSGNTTIMKTDGGFKFDKARWVDWTVPNLQ